MDSKEFVDTSPLEGLYSGRILSAVVQALDIEDEVLGDRTARRFFSGQHVDEYNRNQIFDALGQALITRGLAPETLEDLPEDLPMASVVGMTLMMVCGGMGSPDGPHPEPFREDRRRGRGRGAVSPAGRGGPCPAPCSR